MELISQSQFLSAEELEKLVEIYKLKLSGGGTSSPNCRRRDVPEEQRGQFYDVYMKKREVKLREEWRSKGADKEAEMRAMMDSLDSTSSVMMSKSKVAGANNDHCRKTNSRKFSSSSSVASSTPQRSSMSALNSTIRYSNSASTRTENTNPSKVTNNDATMQRSIARSMSSNERTSLVKDIRFSRSRTLRTNPASVGVRKDFSLQNSRPDTSTPPVHTNHRRRNSMASFEDNEDIQKQMYSNGSFNSAYHRFESSSKIAEILNSGSHVQNIYHSKTSDFDSSVGSLLSGPTTGDSHNMNQYLEGKTIRVRKKWGSVERPFPTVAASPHNDKDDGHDSRNDSSEDSRNSRMGRVPSFGTFGEREILHEQVNSPHNQSHSARLKEREKHLLGNYPKAIRPLFSPPSFHGRENETEN